MFLYLSIVSHTHTHTPIWEPKSDDSLNCKTYTAMSHEESYMIYFVIYFQKLYGRYNDLLQYSPFTVFVWPSPLLICVTYTGLDLWHRIWLVTLLIPRWIFPSLYLERNFQISKHHLYKFWQILEYGLDDCFE